VRSYVLVFKRGYNPSKTPSEQQGFLHSIARKDVTFNTLQGIESILNYWRRYTSAFTSICTELLSCEVLKTDDGAIVKGVTRSCLKINSKSIDTFFPGIKKKEALKKKLLGKILHLSAVTHWCFDSEDRLSQLNGRDNFVTGLLELVHDPEEVACILSGANVIPKDEAQAMKLIYQGTAQKEIIADSKIPNNVEKTASQLISSTTDKCLANMASRKLSLNYIL